jgi:hypothetical protein
MEMNEPETNVTTAAPAPKDGGESHLLAGLKVSLAEKDNAIANLKSNL